MPKTPVTDETPCLQLHYYDLDALLKWPGNPKEHDVGAIAASVLRFGFRDPISVNRQNMEIEEGHGRLDTLKALQQQGRPAPAFVDVRDDGWYVPVLFFEDDEATQRAYALAHNRTQELGGGYDDTKLLDALREQVQLIGHLDGTGFDADDLHALQRQLEGETAADESVDVNSGFLVLVTCANEMQQSELLDRFTREGLQCRALVS